MLRLPLLRVHDGPGEVLLPRELGLVGVLIGVVPGAAKEHVAAVLQPVAGHQVPPIDKPLHWSSHRTRVTVVSQALFMTMLNRIVLSEVITHISSWPR